MELLLSKLGKWLLHPPLPCGQHFRVDEDKKCSSPEVRLFRLAITLSCWIAYPFTRRFILIVKSEVVLE